MNLKSMINIFACSFIMACAPSGTKENEIFQDITLITGTVSFAELQQKFLVPQCLRCHAWVQDEASVASRVVAGNPAGSPLFIQVQSGRMPQGGPPATRGQIALLEAYIKGGGSNLPPPPPLEPKYASLKFHLFDKSCTMCHNGQNRRIPDLRNVNVIRNEIEDILSEIDIGSMPPLDAQGNPKAPIPSDEVIKVLNQWVKLGMP